MRLRAPRDGAQPAALSGCLSGGRQRTEGITSPSGGFTPTRPSSGPQEAARHARQSDKSACVPRLSCGCPCRHRIHHHPNRRRRAVAAPTSPLRQLLQHVGHQRTALLDFEDTAVGNAVLVFIAKPFLFGEFDRKDELSFLKRVPVGVAFEPNERCRVPRSQPTCLPRSGSIHPGSRISPSRIQSLLRQVIPNRTRSRYLHGDPRLPMTPLMETAGNFTEFQLSVSQNC